MQINIANGILGIKLEDTERIEKVVAGKKSPLTKKTGINTQGGIYIHRDFIGQNGLFFLTEPSESAKTPKSFSFNGEQVVYYDMLIREIKSVRVSPQYMTGRVHLPHDWIDKKVTGIILAD